jgi:hypothetical protein
MRILPFARVPNNAVFRVLKEQGRPEPEKGLFIKVGNSRSYAFSKSKEIILALGDMCEVVSKDVRSFNPNPK